MFKPGIRRIVIVTMLLALLVPCSAFAHIINHNNFDRVSGVNAVFVGGNAQTKTVDGSWPSLGVSGGVNGEISIGQSITFNFATAQIVNSLNFAALFANGNYGDKGNEIAQVTGHSSNQSWTYTLTAGKNAAVWTGHGTASPLTTNAGLAGNGGVWQVTNPFGNAAINSIVFGALDNGIAGNMSGMNSDYGIAGMTTTATPIPTAAWLLGSGLMGLVGLRRRSD